MRYLPLLTLDECRELGLHVIAAAGSTEKVELAVARGGPTAKGFSYAGCDGKLFREKLKAVAGKGEWSDPSLVHNLSLTD
jgi:hypothetical protein